MNILNKSNCLKQELQSCNKGIASDYSKFKQCLQKDQDSKEISNCLLNIEFLLEKSLLCTQNILLPEKGI